MIDRRSVLALAGAATASAALAGAVKAEGGIAPADKVPQFALTTPLHVREVALRVADIDNVSAFYRDVLGMEILERSPGIVRLGVDATVLVSLEHDPKAKPVRVTEAGLYHTAFLMPDRTELARWLVHAAAIGYPLTGYADHGVSEAIYLDDPEGNGVEVYADRPSDRWTWEDGLVVMGSRPIDIDGLLELVPINRDTFVAAPLPMRIGHVHLRGGNISDAREFYLGKLGLDAVSGRDDAVFMSWGGYHHHVAVNVWESEGAGRRDRADAGLSRLTFVARDREAFEKTANLLGIPPAMKALETEDPWGTVIHVV